MFTQISSKISGALVIAAAVAGVACSSKDKNYQPGTAYPVGGNVVPADGPPPATAPATAEVPAEPLPPLTPEEIGPTINYTVKKGDSLWLIAKDHKSSISRLKQVNQLATDNIQIGQVLRIPTSAGQPGTAPAAAAPTPAPALAAPTTAPKTTPAPPPTAAPNTTPAAPPTSKFKRPPMSDDPSAASPEKPIAPPSSSRLKIQD
jgi:LysM repeat protein